MLAFANACTLPSVWVVWFSVPGSSESACSRFASSEEIAWKLVFDEEMVLRVGVTGGGCSGFSYALGFDKSFDEKTDSKYEYHGVPVA